MIIFLHLRSLMWSKGGQNLQFRTGMAGVVTDLSPLHCLRRKPRIIPGNPKIAFQGESGFDSGPKPATWKSKVYLTLRTQLAQAFLFPGGFLAVSIINPQKSSN